MNTGSKFEEDTETVKVYRDLQVEVVLDKAANLSDFTCGEEEGLPLHPRCGRSFMEERVNPSRSTSQFISAYVSTIVDILCGNDENDRRSLFGIYELDLGEETEINAVHVKLGKDKEIPDAHLFAPDILFQINGETSDLKPQKFMRKRYEYQIN
jgi:hypothetical protein